MHVKALGLPLAPQVDWEIFEGEVLAEQIVGDGDSIDVRVYDVTFRPGGRTVWHTHTVDQVLVVLSGHGIVATRESERAVRAGDLITFPAGEDHWHGATATTEMRHLALMTEGADEY